MEVKKENKFLKYIEPIWLDDHLQMSGKRIMAILSIVSAILATIFTLIMYTYFIKIDVEKAKSMDLAQITMLIAPLFGNGLILWGVTSYFQQKKDEINQ